MKENKESITKGKRNEKGWGKKKGRRTEENRQDAEKEKGKRKGGERKVGERRREK